MILAQDTFKFPIGFLILIMFMICAPTIRAVFSFLTAVLTDKESDIGPFELEDTSSRSGSMSSPVFIPSGSVSPVDDTGSYDRLSDISPGCSPIEPHSASWRDLGNISSGTQSPTEETANASVERNNAPSSKNRPATFPPSRLPQPTKKTKSPTSATSALGDILPWSPGSNSFSSPAIQEKLRQQSILYHQIHDLLAEHLETKPKNPGEYPKNPTHIKHKPSLPSIPEPKFKIEGVDHNKIRALKEKYPDKKALHKHLDTYSAVMGRFVALCAPEVSILDMKPIEDDDEEEKKPVPPMRKRAATHSGVGNVKRDSMIPTYSYARSIKLEKSPSPTRTVKIEKSPTRSIIKGESSIRKDSLELYRKKEGKENTLAGDAGGDSPTYTYQNIKNGEYSPMYSYGSGKENMDSPRVSEAKLETIPDSPRISKILSELPELSIAEILAKAI
ncbi:hypothetical protein TWF694_008770 [Orbilia ellipsospora]|uniref:Uncharacterized protein n=1 Tax=Orbilia ellipsospora TaxID=2528407 RepID=A0AAV9XCX2_9PEZI